MSTHESRIDAGGVEMVRITAKIGRRRTDKNVGVLRIGLIGANEAKAPRKHEQYRRSISELTFETL
jgi:hypothetical protein